MKGIIDLFQREGMGISYVLSGGIYLALHLGFKVDFGEEGAMLFVMTVGAAFKAIQRVPAIREWLKPRLGPVE